MASTRQENKEGRKITKSSVLKFKDLKLSAEPDGRDIPVQISVPRLKLKDKPVLCSLRHYREKTGRRKYVKHKKNLSLS